ncbi:MAG: diacylglycerol kinase family protein [Fimbriimonadaceae bacterium]
MTDTCVVANPAASSGKAGGRLEELSLHFPGCDVLATERKGHARELAARAVQEGARRVVAAGGDGTVNEVASALIGTEAELAVVPAGSGNDYVRTFGIPSDLASAAQLAREGASSPVDAGRRDDGTWFFNVAGIGFDAFVADRFNRSPGWMRRLGIRTRYYCAVIQAFARYPYPTARLAFDGEEIASNRILLAAVGVCRYYGGGLAVCPEADPTDGLFDVVWGEGLRLGEVVALMGSMPSGGHMRHPKVRSARCRRIEVHCNPAVPCHVEGEIVAGSPFIAESHSGALKLVR